MDDAKTKGYITIRPTKEDDQRANWGEEVLDDGYAEYLKINPFTDDGLNKIAQYNNYIDEWNAEKDQLDDDVTMYKKRWVNWKLYVKYRNRRKIHLDPIEGQHRCLALQQVVLGADIDLVSGMITNPESITVAQFALAGIYPTSEECAPTHNDIILACYNATDRDDGNSPFVKDLVTIKIRFFHDFNEPVKNCLEACRITSAMIANAKRQAAFKDPFTEVATVIDDYFHQFSDQALQGNPFLNNHHISKNNKPPVNLNRNQFDENLVDKIFDGSKYDTYNRDLLMHGFPLLKLLYSNEFEAFCENPFPQSTQQAFMKLFQSYLIVKRGDEYKENQSKNKIMPPFLVNFESMTRHASFPKGKRPINVAMVNKWCILPIIMHILCGASTRRNRQETMKDNTFIQLVKYIMRHHVIKFGVGNINELRVMQYGYDGLRDNANLAAGSVSKVAMAALYITEIMNCALTKIDQHHKLEDKKKKLKSEMSAISDFLSTLAHNSGYLTADKLVDLLGKLSLSS